MLKYVTPAFLIMVFLAWFLVEINKEEGNYFVTLVNDDTALLSVVFISVIVAFFVLITHQALRRWRRIEREQRQQEEQQ